MNGHANKWRSTLWALVLWLGCIGTTPAMAAGVISVETPVHFLAPGDYAVEPAEYWLRVVPGNNRC